MFEMLFPKEAAQLNHIESMVKQIKQAIPQESLTRIENAVNQTNQNLGVIMATYAEAKQAWVDYTTELKTQRDAAVAALEAAQQQAQSAAEALAAFQADDEATDASQLEAQAQSFADDLSSTLEELKNPPTEPEPLPEEPTE